MVVKQDILDINNNIYGNKMQESVNIIKEKINLFKECEDNILDHPFCHESAHQSLTNIKLYTEEYKKKHEFRVEIFKIIWESALKRNIINDLNYQDKYRFTALQRLISDMPKKKEFETDTYILYSLDYDAIHPELAKWIKNNLTNKYKMDLNPIKKKKI